MPIRYSEPLFRPPSEARSLIFQITLGCSRNRCTFCGMYKGKPFRIRPLQEVLKEIAAAGKLFGDRVRRVFLADGDALVYPFKGLRTILDALLIYFPHLTRVGAYASPASLAGKTADELAVLREKRLGILYFGLESGEDAVLKAIDKGYDSEGMAALAQKARAAGIKLSVTAILGLAGKAGSLEHARATAAWVNRVNPEYFSLLTLFSRHNQHFVESLERCDRLTLLQEALELVRGLHPQRTILRSNHVSNFLSLAGSYPKDRERLIHDVEDALVQAAVVPGYLEQVPGYSEEYY